MPFATRPDRADVVVRALNGDADGKSERVGLVQGRPNELDVVRAAPAAPWLIADDLPVDDAELGVEHLEKGRLHELAAERRTFQRRAKA